MSGMARIVDAEIDAEVDAGTAFVLEILALELADRLLRAVSRHVEPDRFDVSALLAAKQVARPADFEIECRDAESAAQIAELANGRQSPASDSARASAPPESRDTHRRGDPIGRRAREADRAAPGRSASARLMMMVLALGMSRPFSTIVVATSTSNLCAHEVDHHLLELRLPASGRGRFRSCASGTELADQLAHRVDRLDAVVDEVDLPAALELGADGARDHRRNRTSRPASESPGDRGGGVSITDMSRMPTQRHVERPRNRRRRHASARRPLLAELLDAFLVRDAEALFFVDDEQPRGRGTARPSTTAGGCRR